MNIFIFMQRLVEIYHDEAYKNIIHNKSVSFFFPMQRIGRVVMRIDCWIIFVCSLVWLDEIKRQFLSLSLSFCRFNLAIYIGPFIRITKEPTKKKHFFTIRTIYATHCVHLRIKTIHSFLFCSIDVHFLRSEQPKCFSIQNFYRIQWKWFLDAVWWSIWMMLVVCVGVFVVVHVLNHTFSYVFLSSFFWIFIRLFHIHYMPWIDQL